jgi:type II secretory pathway component PulF
VVLKRKVALFTQLASLSRAGVPLRQGLANLRTRFSEREVQQLADQIDAGQHIADAFAQAGFAPFEINLIAAGERSGRLEVIFQQLADFWLQEHELTKSIKARIAYPLVVMHLAALLLPITTILESVALYALKVVAGLALLYGLGFGLYVFSQWSWRTETGQALWLRVPWLGRSWRATYAYRWIVALQLEFSAGLPLPQAVADAWRATGYAKREPLARDAEARLNAGENLSVLFARWRQFPEDWLGFLQNGELAGKLEESFIFLVEEAHRDWQRAQAALAEWMPKIFYGLMILIVGIQAFLAYYNNVIRPINAISDAIGS